MNIFERGADAYRRGDAAGAEALFREATAWGFNNLGHLRAETEDFVAAEAFYRQALAVDPGHAGAAYGLSLLLLADGRYAEGWRLHEARRRLPQIYTPAVREGLPEWRGEDLAGRRIAVFGEQGFGDQIMFARFLAELAARGAAVTYFCAAELTELIPGASAVASAELLAGQDCWSYVCTLPLRLGTTLENLPPPLPLAPGRGGGGVGVMVRGRPTNVNDASRSLPPDAAAALLTLGRDLHPEATGARSFAETAEIIRGLDLVISVDTAVAHLAGSMGKPTWVLLPRRFTDWRWLRGRADCPWYPSARLFRQRQRGDWGPVLAEVRAELADRAGG